MGILQRILMKMELLHAKFADIVIVVTRSLGGTYEGFKEFYIKLGVPPDKIRVVWNTPRASMFLNYPKLNLKKPTKFTIGYIGSIRTVSNLSLFLSLQGREDTSSYLWEGASPKTLLRK